MNETRTLPDLADRTRCLLAAVTGALRAERRWGPMALLAWLRTRRQRREAAAALAEFKALTEAFLLLVEQFRAGKLAAQEAPDGDDVRVDPVAVETALPRLRPTVLRIGPSCGGLDGRVKPGHDEMAAGDGEIPRGRDEMSAGHGEILPGHDEARVGHSETASGRDDMPCGTASLRRAVTLLVLDRCGLAGPLFSNGVWRRGANCVHFVTFP